MPEAAAIASPAENEHVDSPGERGALEVRNVWKSYGGPYVVEDVSFTLEPGKLLTLLGPSGSGKTTTLMMAAGFEQPNRGEILVRGRDIAPLSADRRNFGVVFQGYALFPHMSVLENVEFPLRMRKADRAGRRKKALDMLVRVGLEQFAGRRPRELSGGQQQRVALARALVFEPDALLLDEPLGALDKNLREALQLEIKELQTRIGVAILYVTHDQDEAMVMSDHLAVFNRGRIIQIGRPDDVYYHPQTPFVANFLGETNLLGCEVTASDGKFADVRLESGQMGCACEPRGRERAQGTLLLISVRPERIQFLAASEHRDNVIEGEVSSRVFLGSESRYLVSTPSAHLVVKLGNAPGNPRVAVGERVRLGFAREDAQLLTAEATDMITRPSGAGSSE